MPSIVLEALGDVGDGMVWARLIRTFFPGARPARHGCGLRVLSAESGSLKGAAVGLRSEDGFV